MKCPQCDAEVSSYDRKCPLCKARMYPKKSSSGDDVDIDVGPDYSRRLFFLKFGWLMSVAGVVLSLIYGAMLLWNGQLFLLLLVPLAVAGGLSQVYLFAAAIQYTREKQAEQAEGL